MSTDNKRNNAAWQKATTTFTMRYQTLFLIFSFLILSTCDASTTTRRRREQAIPIESEPTGRKAGKGSSKNPTDDAELADNWSDPGEYFSLSPADLQTRITEAPLPSSLDYPSFSPNTPVGTPTMAPATVVVADPDDSDFAPADLETRVTESPASSSSVEPPSRSPSRHIHTPTMAPATVVVTDPDDPSNIMPSDLESRITQAPASSPSLESSSLRPSTTFSDAPSLGPSTSMARSSLGPSTSFSDAPSLAPSSSSAGSSSRSPSEPSSNESPTRVPTVAIEPSPDSAAAETFAPTSSRISDSTTDNDIEDETGSVTSNTTSDSTVMCPGFTPDRLEVVSWTYSVTMDRKKYTGEDADAAVEVLEPQLGSSLLNLLKCENSTGRRLESDFGIVGMDYLPDDLRQKECEANTTLPCFVYLGEMFIFLEEGADTDTAINEMRKAIKAIMSEVEGLSIPNVKHVKYISPKLSDPDSAEENPSSQPDRIQPDETVSSRAIPVLSAMGGLFVIGGMIAAYRMRTQETETIDGPSTIVGGSTGAASQSSLSKSLDEPQSPFSGMLPGAYQMGGQYPMGAILEDASDSGSYSRTSDIIVSDCGYTDEDSSRDHSYQHSMLHDDSSILGARGTDDYDAEEDVLFDDDPTTPSKRKVSFANSQAEV